MVQVHPLPTAWTWACCLRESGRGASVIPLTWLACSLSRVLGPYMGWARNKMPACRVARNPKKACIDAEDPTSTIPPMLFRTEWRFGCWSRRYRRYSVSLVQTPSKVDREDAIEKIVGIQCMTDMSYACWIHKNKDARRLLRYGLENFKYTLTSKYINLWEKRHCCNRRQYRGWERRRGGLIEY